MANLGLQNNNPGNLKDPSTGQFRVFNTPEEGKQALIQDISLKQSGKSSHIKPGASISQLASVWAPASDNNVPANWAHNVSKTIGVDVNTPFDQVPADKLAEGIQVAEGTSTMKTTDDHSSVEHSPLAQKIRAKYPTEYNDLTDQELEQKVLAKYPQYGDLAKGSGNVSQGTSPSSGGYATNPTMIQPSTPQEQNKPGLIQGAVQGVANSTGFLPALSSVGSIANHLISAGDSLVGRDEQAKNREAMANKIDTEGADYGYLGKAKPIGSDFDVSKSLSENTKPILDAVGTGAKIGTTIFGPKLVSGLAGKVFGKGGSTILSSPVVEQALKNYVPEIGSKTLPELMNSGALSAAEQYNAFQAALESANAGDSAVLRTAIKEIAPKAAEELKVPVSELLRGLGETAVKAPGLLSKLGSPIKTGLGVTAVGSLLGLGNSIYGTVKDAISGAAFGGKNPGTLVRNAILPKK